MTLTEYLNQTDPARMPNVTLQAGEYEIQGGGHKMADGTYRIPVFIPAVNYCYIYTSGSRLETMDRDGNPKNPSCFWLPIEAVESIKSQFKNSRV